jgi:hypothetical protein
VSPSACLPLSHGECCPQVPALHLRLATLATRRSGQAWASAKSNSRHRLLPSLNHNPQPVFSLAQLSSPPLWLACLSPVCSHLNNVVLAWVWEAASALWVALWEASAGIATRSMRPLCDNQRPTLEKAMLWSPRPPPRSARPPPSASFHPERTSESFCSNGIDKHYGISAFQVFLSLIIGIGHGVMHHSIRYPKGERLHGSSPSAFHFPGIDKAAKRSDWYFIWHFFFILGRLFCHLSLSPGTLSPLPLVGPQPRARYFWSPPANNEGWFQGGHLLGTSTS